MLDSRDTVVADIIAIITLVTLALLRHFVLLIRT